jgi:hypothetical protein
MKTNEIISKRSKKQRTAARMETEDSVRLSPAKLTDELRQNYFIHPPFFNFIYAEDELGLNFLELSEDGFSEFLYTIFTTNLIDMRKAYIRREYSIIRFISHKFKSPFT